MIDIIYIHIHCRAICQKAYDLIGIAPNLQNRGVRKPLLPKRPICQRPII